MTEVHVVNSANKHLYREILEHSFRVRHQVFVKELGWKQVARDDGVERDAYDDDGTIYLLAIDKEKLVGGQRLRPTIKPHLLLDVFPHLVTRQEVPVDRSIWEWSRYFVIRERRMGRTDCCLLAAIQEFSLEEDILQLQALVDAWWLPRWHSHGFKVHPIGLPELIDDRWAVPALIDVDYNTLERVRKTADLNTVLVRQGPQFRASELLRQEVAS